jgi:hypothetical protein
VDNVLVPGELHREWHFIFLLVLFLFGLLGILRRPLQAVQGPVNQLFSPVIEGALACQRRTEALFGMKIELDCVCPRPKRKDKGDVDQYG